MTTFFCQLLILHHHLVSIMRYMFISEGWAGIKVLFIWPSSAKTLFSCRGFRQPVMFSGVHLQLKGEMQYCLRPWDEGCVYSKSMFQNIQTNLYNLKNNFPLFPFVRRMFQQTSPCACLFSTSVCLSERYRRCWPTVKTGELGWVMWWTGVQTIRDLQQWSNAISFCLFQSPEAGGRRTLLYGQTVLFRHAYSDMVGQIFYVSNLFIWKVF